LQCCFPQHLASRFNTGSCSCTRLLIFAQ
jgi:hypothetical protein